MLSYLRAARETTEDGEGLLVIIIKTPPVHAYAHRRAEVQAQNTHTRALTAFVARSKSRLTSSFFFFFLLSFYTECRFL